MMSLTACSTFGTSGPTKTQKLLLCSNLSPFVPDPTTNYSRKDKEWIVAYNELGVKKGCWQRPK